MVSSLAKSLEIRTPFKYETKKAPVKWCTVSLSEVIERGKRLEASVFDVEGKNARELIKSCKYPLASIGGENGLTTSYTCARFKRIWLEDSEYPIYQPSTILDINPKPDGYISQLTKTNIEALRVKKGQILLTCSGTIGNISLVSQTLDDTIFSHDLLRISCKEDTDIGYIYTFLKSKTGNKILLTNSYGAVVTHIESEHLAEIPIPNPPKELKEKIHNLIIGSFVLRDESNELIDKATKLMVKELNLLPIHEIKIETFEEKAEVQTFSVKLSEINSRLDASYHVPIVDAIIKHLQEYAEEVTTIGDSRVSKKIILAGVFKRIYVDEEYGIPFLGGREISQLNPRVEKFLSKPHHKARYEKELKVSENTILVTDRGTVGKVALVPKHWNGWAVSQNVLKLVPSDNTIAGYVFIYLNSEWGNTLIKRETYGSVVDMIDNINLSTIPIPLLKNKEIQKQINELALEANEKRYQAHKLEQQALKIMDNEVIYAQ
ncbi:MAG: restriction endonuclease subunit S [Sedimentibacter sp.]